MNAHLRDPLCLFDNLAYPTNFHNKNISISRQRLNNGLFVVQTKFHTEVKGVNLQRQLTNWETIIPFLQYPKGLRRIIYTTNAIESLNMALRKIIKNRGHFPSEEAALKLLFLALKRDGKPLLKNGWKRRLVSISCSKIELHHMSGKQKQLTQNSGYVLIPDRLIV